MAAGHFHWRCAIPLSNIGHHFNLIGLRLALHSQQMRNEAPPMFPTFQRVRRRYRAYMLLDEAALLGYRRSVRLISKDGFCPAKGKRPAHSYKNNAACEPYLQTTLSYWYVGQNKHGATALTTPKHCQFHNLLTLKEKVCMVVEISTHQT